MPTHVLLVVFDNIKFTSHRRLSLSPVLRILSRLFRNNLLYGGGVFGNLPLGPIQLLNITCVPGRYTRIQILLPINNMYENETNYNNEKVIVA